MPVADRSWRSAKRRDAYIVEDDIYGIYAAKGGLTYRELAPERVYYLTSLSKCLSPLLRLGVLVPPTVRLEGIKRSLRAQLSGVAPIVIELGCALIEQGAADTAAASLRAEAQARSQLAKQIFGLDSLPMPGGAPHIWLPMEQAAADRLACQALDRGVRVATGAGFSISGNSPAGVRLSILAPQERADAERALKIVQELRPTLTA